MYEPYDFKKESKIKKFLNNLRDKFIAFKQELHFKDIGPNKWIIIFVPLTLILLVGLTYTGYVTYTGRITETQSKIMVLEKQMEGLQTELDKTTNQLNACNSDLSSTKKDLASNKSSLEESQKNIEICSYERENLLKQLDDKQKELNNWITKYNDLEKNYKSLECSWAQSKGCVFYVVKSNGIECCYFINNEYYCGPGVLIETPEDKVKSC